MYSKKVTEKLIDDFIRRNGWSPVYHSESQVEEFKNYVNGIVDMTQNSVNRYIDFKQGVRLTQKEKDRIRQWIINEQFLCFADADYFKTRYAFLCNEQGDIFKYKPRDSQKVFTSILSQFDEQQVAIELFVLKARQQGISTEVSLDFLHRLLFIPHTNAVMASVQGKQSELLSRMQETCWDRLPFWLVPPKTVVKSDRPQWANGSILSIQSGSQATGIAQGWTPTLIHISELGDIPNPEKTLEEGLFRAAHSSKKLFFVMEGTGNGDTSWQAKKWRYYKENWGKGGRFCPIFIPWPCAKDLYPEADWLRKNPIPEGWTPIEETRRMINKCELYIRNTDYLARIMGVRWEMPKKQAWFWETNYREAIASHTQKTWFSQMPCTDGEALQSKNDPVFDDDVTAEIWTKREKNYTAYAITGRTILIGKDSQPTDPDPSTIDYSKQRIPISWTSPDGNEYSWELVPLKEFDDSTDEACYDKLLVFHSPSTGLKYSMGCDTADGLGMPQEDRSCLSVTMNSAGKDRDIQCAEFTSINCNSPQMARIAAAVAAWYGTECGDEMGVKMAIEQRRKPGDECQHQLKLMGFYNHHKFIYYDGSGLPDPTKAHKEGWFTNGWSRPMLLNKFIDAINGGWYKPESPILIRQIKSLVRKETSGVSRIEHKSGEHDDNFFSGAMSYFTAHDMESTAKRQEGKYKPKSDEGFKLNLEWPSVSFVIE